MEKHEHYTYRITWSAEDREYVGLCAEFPSLSWLAATRTGALEGIEKVVSETIDDMLAQGETPPQALAEKNFSGKLVLRMTPEQHRRLAIGAMEEGVSLNRYLCARLAGRGSRAAPGRPCRRQAKRCFAAAIAAATCCGATPPLAARLSRQDCKARIG